MSYARAFSGSDTAGMGNAIRFLTMDAVEEANSGHPGMPMGMADVAAVLFRDHIKLDPAVPYWPDRDRFVLSAGHGSMLQYAIHYLLGYRDMPIEALQRFRKFGATTAGHPEFGHCQGVEATTGPLGQGIAMAVGMAIAERMQNARFGNDLVDHYTYVMAGDGCLMEGISQEAIDLAGHLQLGRLIVLWDDNGISIDGRTNLSTSTHQLDRFAASGWDVVSVNGYDHDEISSAISVVRKSVRPSLIACRTVIGRGAPTKQGTEGVHGAPLGAAEISSARQMLDWPHEPFVIPENILEAWRDVARRGASARHAWEQRLAQSSAKDDFERIDAGELPASFSRRMSQFKEQLVATKPKVATRKASEMALAVINDETDLTIGGSADLTHSNLTLTEQLKPAVSADSFRGRYLHYGIREHAMAAAMNGIALHGGFIPYGGTFLVFSDYARGAIRLSALMRQRVIYVLTHDSIGLGEDGPTHQPIEHLASLRAIPNLNVFRPADVVETAECWELALALRATPSALCLSRQTLPTLRRDCDENLSAKGAYVLHDVGKARDVTLLATGSEVEIAMIAAESLNAGGIKAAVVSMPCWELFEAQDPAYRAAVLGKAPRIGIEAAARLGWDRWIGDTGRFVGMSSFGASGPASELYRHFKITPDDIIDIAKYLARPNTSYGPSLRSSFHL
ncbi:transketolase [Hyphomicrobium methylovorum]|uniref:transketolase n=1 Tax=Hyphomicrobium methylovorum TaxID=84 RepID=UPI0015E789B5|nr:transketolase [Hyphomicrobium methylovorum]MBA2127435.1 transketolase [Hyphomicrobium methylovorum]